MQNTEELRLWYDITEHAKTNWEQEKLLNIMDSSSFEKKNEKSDQILFYILASFASGESIHDIQQNIYNELKFHSCPICQETLKTILQDIQVQLKESIYAVYLAFQMLEDGATVNEVSTQVEKLFTKPSEA